jgi:hypothetical protein
MGEHPAEFKVMWSYRREENLKYERLGCPRTVPWGLVWPHDAQARKNHGHWQGVKRLNERGGLSPSELVAVLTGVCWSKIDPDPEVSVPRLKALLAEYRAQEVE